MWDNFKQVGLINRRLNHFPPLLVKNKGLRVVSVVSASWSASFPERHVQEMLFCRDSFI